MDDSYSHFNNNRVKYSHERSLWLICGGKTFLYEEQLEKGGSASIYHKNSNTCNWNVSDKKWHVPWDCLFLIFFAHSNIYIYIYIYIYIMIIKVLIILGKNNVRKIYK